MKSIASQFELARHGDAPNMRPMEGMRGFAVFLVFLVHFVTLSSPWIPPYSALDGFADSVHTLGNAGVDLFFVLSGYLIYGSILSRPQRFMPFIRRRIARIYPAFCVVFAIYLGLSFAFPKESKIPTGVLEGWKYVLENFLLLPGLFPIEPIITVAWSLSYEIFYYMAIPLLVGLFRLRQTSARWRVPFFVALAVAFTFYCALRGGPVRLLMFFGGVLLHEAMQSKTLPAPRNSLVLGLLVTGLLSTTIAIQGAFLVKIFLLLLTFFMVCHACFTNPDSPLARGFSWTPLRWLGNMSYSYYLVHGLALKVGFMVLFARMPKVEHEILFVGASLPLMFLLTLLPSACLFLLVERPLSLSPAVPAATPARAPLPLLDDVAPARQLRQGASHPG